jgi:hypothetical protein
MDVSNVVESVNQYYIKFEAKNKRDQMKDLSQGKKNE